MSEGEITRIRVVHLDEFFSYIYFFLFLDIVRLDVWLKLYYFHTTNKRKMKYLFILIHLYYIQPITMQTIGPSKKTLDYITHSSLSLTSLSLPQPHNSLSRACVDQARGRGASDGAAHPAAAQGLEPGWTRGAAPQAAAPRRGVPPASARLRRVPPTAAWLRRVPPMAARVLEPGWTRSSAVSQLLLPSHLLL